ncbi:MAG: hypothetical protein JSU74_13285 [Candidatus Zixiibacteriota bacterium]|nr:MAG: hypothetical protein JSU74_13285 [candidate division Zixibacteria bacterium]
MITSGIVVLALSPDAHAYIDPSTGSYMLQILLAGLLGALFTLKIFWRNLKGFLTRFLTGRRDDVKAD